MEPKAKQLLREARTPSKKPKPKDLKTLRKAGVSMKPAAKPGASKRPFTRPMPWPTPS